MPMPERSRRTPSRKAGAKKAVARHPASNPQRHKRPLSPRVRHRRIVLVAALGSLAVIAVLFVFVYPTSTFLHQRAELNAGEQRIAKLDVQTKLLEAQNKLLQGDAEVERIAREQYGLVRPGETPYVIVPAATTPTTTTPTTTAPITTAH
jgi:cell division protein FtsB